MESAEALFRQAAEHQRFGRYAQAAALYERVAELAPDAAVATDNLALALLGAGDYARGFPLYERRFTRAQGRVPKPKLSFPEWTGEPLAGRSILIWEEQGFGDQIMLARFVPALASMGARVSLLAAGKLACLFSHLPATIIEASGRVAIPRHDFWIMPGSIPARLGTTLETLPNAPYLPGADGGRGVGVAWRGDPRHHNDAHRSLPPELGRRLLDELGAVSLAPDDTGAHDFAATAEIIEGLALVVTVDTSVAHLAGAMGKPVFTLLPHRNCDWRWMAGRSDTPWYPSMRLFRQDDSERWEPVIEAALAKARGLIGAEA